MQQYQEALRLNPDYAEPHYNLGNAVRDLGRLRAAVAHYQEAIRLKPDYADAHNNLGNVLGDQGELEEAIACYRRSIQLKPANALRIAICYSPSCSILAVMLAHSTKNTAAGTNSMPPPWQRKSSLIATITLPIVAYGSVMCRPTFGAIRWAGSFCPC